MSAVDLRLFERIAGAELAALGYGLQHPAAELPPLGPVERLRLRAALCWGLLRNAEYRRNYLDFLGLAARRLWRKARGR